MKSRRRINSPDIQIKFVLSFALLIQQPVGSERAEPPLETR